MPFRFAENEELESLDTVPEDFRGLYEQEGDVYRISENAKTVTRAIDGLHGALKKSRTEAKALRGKTVDLSALTEYGETPEEIATTFSERLKELSSKQPNLDKMRSEWAVAHKKELEAVSARATGLEQQLHTVLVTNAATNAIAAAQGNTKLLMPFVSGQIKLVESNGRPMAAVVDDDGEVRYSPTTGAPLTPAELVNEMKSQEEFAPLFKATTPAGGGSNSRQQRGTNQQRQTSDMTSTEKINLGLQKNKMIK